MPKTKYLQNNLNAGELSPLLEGRTDIDKYFNAVGAMRNFLPMVQGGAARRPGFHLADYAKYSDKKCRLIPFEFGTLQAYVVEVGDGYMRFYMDGYLIRQVTGGDLITNGAFATDLTGWTDYSVSPGTAIWETAKAKLDGGATGIGSLGQSIATVSGKTYLLTFDVATNPLHVRIGTSVQGDEIVYDIQYSVGSKQIMFIARGTTTYIQFLRKSNGAAYLDNVICKEYTPIEISSPYQESELPLLKWAQNSDNLFIAHPNHQVKMLTRMSSVAWTLTEMEFTDGPYFEQVVSSKITPSHLAVSIETIINGGFDTDTDWVKGANWTISGGKANKSSGALNNLSQDHAGAIGEIYRVIYTIDSISGGSLTVSVGGANGTARSIPGTYAEYIVTVAANSNIIFTPSLADVVCQIDDVSSFRIITMTASTDLWYSGHVGALWRLGYYNTATPPVLIWGYVKIISVEDTKHCHAMVMTTLPATTATDAHREGRWSTLRGFPCSDMFHENRFVLGGAATSPQTFWGSKHEQWDDHTPGILDDDAISFTIGSNKVNIIHWLASARTLIIGTPGGEFRAGGGGDNPITPSNIDVKNETTHEVLNAMPLRIGNAILYIQRAGKQIMEMIYNFDADAYEADDLTTYSDHLTQVGLTELAHQRGYNPMVWVIRGDGKLLSLVYNLKQKVAGWSQQSTDGTIESIAIIPNPVEKSDDVYVVVKRTINGTEKRFIEYFDPYLNVDCGLSLVSSILVGEISGLEHLIGEVVDIVGDGAVYPQEIVDSNGKVYLDPPAYSVEVGKHYDSYMKTLRPEIKGQTTMSCHKKWSKIFVRLYETVGLKINGEVIPFRSSKDPMNFGITPYTGDRHIVNTGWEDEGRIEIEQTLPLPATILCIFGDLEISED